MIAVAGIFSLIFGFIGGIHLSIGLTRGMTVFIVTGSVCLALFAFCMFFVLRYCIRLLRLPKTGRKVWALITGFSMGEDMFEKFMDNGRRAKDGVTYSVSLKCEAGGKEYHYGLNCADPDSLIGKCIPIYFSQSDPDFYRFAPKEIH